MVNGYTIRTDAGEWRAFHPDWYGGKVPVFGSPDVFTVIRWAILEG